jgi:hypothetical protein
MPGWQAIRLAEAPEISQFSLLYDQEVVEPEGGREIRAILCKSRGHLASK